MYFLNLWKFFSILHTNLHAKLIAIYHKTCRYHHFLIGVSFSYYELQAATEHFNGTGYVKVATTYPEGSL